MSKQRIWLDVGVEVLCVADFPLPSVFNDDEDKLRCLLSRRLVGSAVCALCFVRSFRARMDDGRGIVVDFCIVCPHPRRFEEFRAVARGVCYLRPNEADEVLHGSRFVVQDLKEERGHDLTDSCEVGVVRLPVNWLEFLERIGELYHDFLGSHCVRR